MAGGCGYANTIADIHCNDDIPLFGELSPAFSVTLWRHWNGERKESMSRRLKWMCEILVNCVLIAFLTERTVEKTISLCSCARQISLLGVLLAISTGCHAVFSIAWLTTFTGSSLYFLLQLPQFSSYSLCVCETPLNSFTVVNLRAST